MRKRITNKIKYKVKGLWLFIFLTGITGTKNKLNIKSTVNYETLTWQVMELNDMDYEEKQKQNKKGGKRE